MYKLYFDKGLALSNYFKYLIAFYGLASLDLKATMYIAFGYAFFCVALGWFWINYRLIETEAEISNILNPFQREVREKLNGFNKK